MNDKIGERHLCRKAVLYVRQSSSYQVLHNEESRRLQYAMRHQLEEFGWKEIEVIDEDLGRSAAGNVERTGFQRMVAEVCLGRVGVVAAREVSRFARNSRDWQQLIEVCRVVDTLLMDLETVYDPRKGNDRLLLGLKGSLNEYELDLLRLRSLEARRAKARRGELILVAPIGYRRTDDERLEKDPDMRVQQAIRLAYDKFLELGTVRQTMIWFLDQGLTFPGRHFGIAGWETIWKRPSYQALLRVLRDPVYAGAYTYGKTSTSAAFREGRPAKTIVRKPMEDWSVLIRDHHEAYISWDLFLRISQMISKNAQAWIDSNPGAPKTGASLLAGILRCGRCGRKLLVQYTGRESGALRYVCIRGRLDQGEERCISFGGVPVDEAMSREVRKVVRPGAIEAARIAEQGKVQRQDDVLRALGLELDAARFEADRAGRQFHGVEPENRLVAAELERRWNATLEKVREVESRISQVEQERTPLDPAMSGSLSSLPQDFDRVWDDSAADVRLKKRIVRTLVQEVIADVDKRAAEVVLVIHWVGGIHSELRVRRRRRGESNAHTPGDIVEAVGALALVCGDTVIAGYLNRNGVRTGMGHRWTRQRVMSLRAKRGMPAHTKETQDAEGWMTLTQAAAHVGVSLKTMRRAIEKGTVSALHPLADGPWILKRAELDAGAARQAIIESMTPDPAGHDPAQLSLDLPT